LAEIARPPSAGPSNATSRADCQIPPNITATSGRNPASDSRSGKRSPCFQTTSRIVFSSPGLIASVTSSANGVHEPV